ncbi:hypothetical protein SBA6_1070002 [Candidatus Sulfopaludibacter sp. SbA6]|nr:hypothetical protein SBA6_1070002 [Candidatus Sulfopaludibacter sp. SbA6]
MAGPPSHQMLMDRLDSNLTGHDPFWTEADEGSLLALRHAARIRDLDAAVLGPTLFIAVVGHRLRCGVRAATGVASGSGAVA